MIDRNLCRRNLLYCNIKNNSLLEVKNYLINELGVEEKDLPELEEKLSFSLSDKCREITFSDCRELSARLFLLISKQENLKRKERRKNHKKECSF